MAETKDDLGSKFITLGWKVLFLLAVLFCYLSIGAILFSFLEYNARKLALEEAVEELEENRAQLLKVLWSGALAKSEDDWTLFANERMDMYESELVDYVEELRVDVKNPEASANPWSLQGSFFYSFTIVTTIGYGNLAPATAYGKVATVIYGLIGIPMTLYLLTVIGKCLTIGLKLWSKQISSNLASDISDEFNFGPAVIVLLLGAYFSLGSVLFGYMEEWDWLDASYFSFITFTTVGLGDLVLENMNAAILATIFIFSALSLFSLIFNVFQQMAEVQLERLYAYCCDKMKTWNIRKEKKSEEESSSFTRIPPYQTSGISQVRNAYGEEPPWKNEQDHT